MKPLLCKILGHQEFSEEVRATRPWLDPDFYDYAEEDFRELNCLRCGEPLPRAAA